MGCTSSVITGTESNNNGSVQYNSVLPEEKLSKVTSDATVDNRLHLVGIGSLEKTNVESHELLPSSFSSLVVSSSQRDVHFTSGLIFTEAVHEQITGDPSDNTPDVSSLLFRLIKKGELSEIKTFVSSFYKGKEDDYCQIHQLRGMWSSSPLMVAVQYNQDQVTDYLLSLLPSSSSRDILSIKNEKGASFLTYATIEGKNRLLQSLFIESGCYRSTLDCNLITDPSSEPIYNPSYDQSMICSPLSLSITNGNVEVFQLFLKNLLENSSDLLSFSLIDYRFPFSVGNVKKSMLNSNNSTGTNKCIIFGVTPLLLAILYGQEEIVNEILLHFSRNEKSSDAILKNDNDSGSCFHYLARLTAKDTSGGDSENGSQEGRSAFKNVRIFCIFSRFGLVSVESLDSKDNKGDTALHLCIENNQLDLARLILKEGANPSVVNSLTGFTPLHVAVRRRSLEGVKLLTDSGADPLSSYPPCSQSPYDLFCTQKVSNPEILKILRESCDNWKKKDNVVIGMNDFVEKEAESRKDDIVEKFTPLEDTFCEGSPTSKPIKVHLSSPPFLQSFLLDDEADNLNLTLPSAIGPVQEVDLRIMKDFQDAFMEPSFLLKDYIPLSDIAPLETKGNVSALANENYLQTSVSSEKHIEVKEDQAFEDFVDSLLEDSSPYAVEISNVSAPELVSKPIPPRNPKASDSNSYQGRRVSSFKAQKASKMQNPSGRDSFTQQKSPGAKPNVQVKNSQLPFRRASSTKPLSENLSKKKESGMKPIPPVHKTGNAAPVPKLVELVSAVELPSTLP
jgi:ankyrin repeat protein